MTVEQTSPSGLHCSEQRLSTQIASLELVASFFGQARPGLEHGSCLINRMMISHQNEEQGNHLEYN